MADQYKDLSHTAAQIDSTIDGFSAHAADTVSHVTLLDRESWNAKAGAADLTAEAQARESADSTLAADLAAETQAREDADTALQAAIEAKPSVESVTITPANVAFTAFQYSAVVTGDILTVNVRAVPANELGVSTSFLLASVASGYRPPYIIACSCFANNVLRQCWINSEGGVRLRIDEAIPAGSTIVISCSFNHNDDKWTEITNS